MTEANQKSIYYNIRIEQGLTREEASEKLQCITPSRLERIENEKSVPNPDEVIIMAKAYNAPELCNHFCSQECAIGRELVPEIKIADISQIVLQMIDSINTVEEDKNRMIRIAVDGVISDDEIPEFVEIQENLEKVSMTLDALNLWVEKMKNSGKINKELYDRCRLR